MPFPVIPLESSESAPRGALQLVRSPQAAPRARYVYARALAHFVDLLVVEGMSLYVAKFFSLVFVAMHGRAISGSGRHAIPLFHEAYDYSSAQLLAASFAAIALLYFVGFPLVAGRTPGLGLLGLRIHAENGQAITLRQLSLRMLGCGFAYATFGLAVIAGYRRRDGKFLQDSMSETSVVRE
jgi:uncharacterized RDD family membrane protein YckC